MAAVVTEKKSDTDIQTLIDKAKGPWFKEGDPNAQFKLAEKYSTGDGVPKDKNLAFKWNKKAAKQGHAFAQWCVGLVHLRGEIVPQNAEKACKWFRRAAEQGHMKAQYKLGCAYAKGEGVPKEPKLAYEWHKKSADQRLPSAQHEVGLAYAKGGVVPRDPKVACEWYAKAAENGHLESIYLLGIAYDKGEGVSLDKRLAFKCFERVANDWYSKTDWVGQEDGASRLRMAYRKNKDIHKDFIVDARFRMGLAYEKGEGVGKDLNTAFVMISTAAGQGHSEAQKWCRNAAEQGNVDAQYWLAEIHRKNWFHKTTNVMLEGRSDSNWDFSNDEGIKIACEWYQKAALKGHAGAQFRLGEACESGDGVPKDKKLASEWYQKAARLEHQEAQEWCRSKGLQWRVEVVAGAARVGDGSDTPRLETGSGIYTPLRDAAQSASSPLEAVPKNVSAEAGETLEKKRLADKV